MHHLAHMKTLLPHLSCRMPLFSERVLVQNFTHKNDLILLRMNIQVTYIFIRIVLHEYLFCHSGMQKWPIYSWAGSGILWLFILDGSIFCCKVVIDSAIFLASALKQGELKPRHCYWWSASTEANAHEVESRPFSSYNLLGHPKTKERC